MGKLIGIAVVLALGVVIFFGVTGAFGFFGSDDVPNPKGNGFVLVGSEAAIPDLMTAGRIGDRLGIPVVCIDKDWILPDGTESPDPDKCEAGTYSYFRSLARSAGTEFTFVVGGPAVLRRAGIDHASYLAVSRTVVRIYGPNSEATTEVAERCIDNIMHCTSAEDAPVSGTRIVELFDFDDSDEPEEDVDDSGQVEVYTPAHAIPPS